MTKKLILIILAALLLSACAPATTAPDVEPIKIGAIFDLSGPTADAGTPYSSGIRAYVDYLNVQGGIDGREIELIWADFAYDVGRAEQLYSQRVTQDQVVAFQGWGTGDTEALRTRIAEDQIPFMSASLSATLGDPAQSPYNFLVGTNYSDQLKIIIDYAVQNSDGHPVIAYLHHDSPFGLSPVADGEDYAEARGAKLFPIPMPRGATDYTAELTQVQSAGADVIVIQNVTSPAATLAKDVDRLGLDVQIICMNYCTDELFISLAGDAADGVIGSSSFAFPHEEVAGLGVIREYAGEHGHAFDRVHYVQGWVTMAVMVEAIRTVIAAGDAITGANIRAALETLTEFETGGITAPITFTPTDHDGNPSVRLYRVENGVWVAFTDYLQAEGSN